MRILVSVVLFLGSGCLGAKAGYKMVELEQSWPGVEAVQASEFAVYEYTLAKEYRAKAWEEAGYNKYGAAELLTDKADGFARTAEQVAKEELEAQRILEEMNQDEGLLPEQVEVPSSPDGLDEGSENVLESSEDDLEEEAAGFPNNSQEDEVLEDWVE